MLSRDADHVDLNQCIQRLDTASSMIQVVAVAVKVLIHIAVSLRRISGSDGVIIAEITEASSIKIQEK